MAERHFMNPQMGRHFGAKPKNEGRAEREVRGEHEGHDGKADHGHGPHIHIHSHEHGHTVHIMHSDGRHEMHEHAPGDAEGIAEHIHEHLGGGEGQDHGYSSDEEMENEHGNGPGV